MVKNLPARQETWVWSLVREDPGRSEWQPTPIFLPGESHGQRSLAGYSPWGCKEWDTTERLTLLSCISYTCIFKTMYLFICLCWALVAACRIFDLCCGMQDLFRYSKQGLVSWPGIKPGRPALGAQNVGHWTTRGVLSFSSWFLEVLSVLDSSLYVMQNIFSPFVAWFSIFLWCLPMKTSLIIYFKK